MRTCFRTVLVLLGASAAASLANAQPAVIRRPALVAGEASPKGVMLEAGPGGASWAFPGGPRLTARAGAVLKIWGSPQTVYLGQKKTPAYTVTLEAGTIRAMIPEAATTAIVVAAPHEAVALVGAGEAAVHAGDQVAVAKASGVTLVRTGGEAFRPLEPGTVALLGRDGDRRQPLLPSPQGLKGSTVLVSYGEPVKTNGIAWEAVAGATAYRADIRRTESDVVLMSTETAEPRLEPGVARLAPGSYQLRLVSIDATGMESAVPLTRELHVIQVEVPAGGHVDASGAVRVPQGRSVQLSYTQGVEMTYGNRAHFFPAPTALEFLQAEPRLVRFRAPGDSDAQSLWLLPREAHARVEFGSKAPVWPGEPLQVRVRLTEAGGDDARRTIELHPEVRVGIDPVKVEFTQQGDWLSGAVPARPGGGPWVVRVEVRDQHGIEIGRDFVEVAGRTSDPSATRGKSGGPRAQAATTPRAL